MSGGSLAVVSLFLLVRAEAGLAVECPEQEGGRLPVPAKCAGRGGFAAEVEVNLGGRVSHGRILVESGGRIHLEHLDAEAARCCREHLQALRRESGEGWDTRRRPQLPPTTRHTWTRVGAQELIAEVYWTVGTVPHRMRFTRHQTPPRQP